MKHLCTDVYAASNTSCVKNQTIFDKKLANIKIELTKMEREISKTVCFYLFIYLFEKHLLGNDGMMTKYISKSYFLSKSQLMLFFVFLFLLLLLLLSFFFFLGGGGRMGKLLHFNALQEWMGWRKSCRYIT